MRKTLKIMVLFVAYCLMSGSVVNGSDFRIDDCNGASAIFVDGKPEFSLFLFSEEITADYGEKFTDCGFKFYSSIEAGHYLDLGWEDDYKFSFSHIDKLLADFSKRVPNGYILPKVHVWASQWWVEKYPEELMGLDHKPEDYKFVNGSGPKHESFASLRWKQEAGYGLRMMVRHIMKSPYRDKVMGIFVAGGQAGEWHPWYWLADNTIDTSEPMRRAFVKYLKRKYHSDVSELRDAWSDDSITFECVKVPLLDERHKTSCGIFLSRKTSQRVIDYRLASHEIVADLIEYFSGIVKEESDGKLLTCVQYGYTPDIPWATQDIHHRAGEKLLSMKCVDIVTSPHSYYSRGLGEPGALRHYNGSLNVHGKLFIDEADERTHLSKPRNFACHATNLEESLSIFWRSFANVVTSGAGMWYMDHTSGKWYDNPAFFDTFAKIRKWADYSMKLSRESVAEVAVVCSMQSEFYLGTTTDLGAQFIVKQRTQLAKTGAPADWYLIDDLEQGLVPEHKVYIFLDCFYLTDGQRKAIDSLKQNNNTLVWFYAPGFVGGRKCSVKELSELTSIDFELSDAKFDFIKLDRKLFPDAPERFRGWQENYFGDVRYLSPRFVPTDKDIEVFGCYPDTKEAAVFQKQQGSWKSVYVANANLPWQVLKQVYTDSGVHLYSESGDVVSVNHSWLGVHAASSGLKKIVLPSKRPVFDVINEKQVSSGVRGFEFEMKKGETALFVFSKNGNGN